MKNLPLSRRPNTTVTDRMVGPVRVVSVKLYDTPIAEFQFHPQRPDGERVTIHLNTGGYWTATTRRRMEQALREFIATEAVTLSVSFSTSLRGLGINCRGEFANTFVPFLPDGTLTTTVIR